MTHLYNSLIFKIIKLTKINMLLKPNEPTHFPTSYSPVGLLPVMGKILEKLFLKHNDPILESQNVILDHQFGFRSLHSTIL